MSQWYENNRRLFDAERKSLAAVCPLMRMAVVGPGFQINSVLNLKHESVVAHGTYTLKAPDSKREIEYGIALVLPSEYPKFPPEMFCNDPKLPIGDINRHIMNDGRACLGVQADISMRWRSGSTIVEFAENFVTPFLIWQAYYDVYKKPPPWGERSHHKQGILEFYADLLGSPIDASVMDFMRLLARKNRPKGHEPCPCNSGKRLRICHRDLLYELRERIAWQDVEKDLAVLLRTDITKE